MVPGRLGLTCTQSWQQAVVCQPQPASCTSSAALLPPVSSQNTHTPTLRGGLQEVLTHFGGAFPPRQSAARLKSVSSWAFAILTSGRSKHVWLGALFATFRTSEHVWARSSDDRTAPASTLYCVKQGFHGFHRIVGCRSFSCVYRPIIAGTSDR